MKTTYTVMLSAIALSATAVLSTAQDQNRDRPGGRPQSPIVAALDANKDGEIDATELANATAALKTLDKNADGKLSGDEFRPQRGDRGPGGPGGPGGRAPEAGGAGGAKKE